MTPRAATQALFFINGVVVGTWIASIPGLKASLTMSATELGLVLLAAAVGSLLAQQVTGQLLVHVPSRRLVVRSALVFPLLAPLPLLAPNPPVLALTLFVFAYANGTMDMAMNAHGVAIETRDGRSFMSRLHAAWSLGAFAGAFAVAAATALGIAALAEAVAVGLVMWLAAVTVIGSLGPGSLRTEGARGFHLPSRRALPVALLIIPVAFAAGGIADWGGVYLRYGLDAGAQLAAFAFAAYSLGLFLGRVGGDRVKDRIGSVRLLQLGCLVAALTIAAFLVTGDPYVTLLGMTITGIGLANNFPQLYAAAGRISPVGPSLSAVFTFSTLAFMVQPAIMGVTSDAVGIRAAMWLPAVAVLVIAVAVGRVPAVETSQRLRSRAAPEPTVPAG